MTFNKGDVVVRKALGNPRKYQVEHVAGDFMWIYPIDSPNDGDIRSVNAFELWGPYKVGYTYRNNTQADRTFDCHFTGNFGAGQDGNKYAAGQINQPGLEPWPAVLYFENADRWTET